MILNQPGAKIQWVSAYRPVGFHFVALSIPKPIENVVVDIFFDGVLYATIRKPFYQEITIFTTPARLFAVDVQRYAQNYLGPFSGVKSDAAPNYDDFFNTTPVNLRFENKNHYCSCFIRARYEFDRGDGVIVEALRGDQSESFMICNSTLQHYESFEANGYTPTQTMKPFYTNNSRPFKWLTNKKNPVKCLRYMPMTMSCLAYRVHGYAVVTKNSAGAVIRSGIASMVPRAGFTFTSNYHARVGVGDPNIGLASTWVTRPPFPMITSNVATWEVQIVWYFIFLGIVLPIPMSEKRIFYLSDCPVAFQLDYMNPLGGFDSYIFDTATITSTIQKKADSFMKSLATVGYNDGTWNTRDSGMNDLNIEAGDEFTVNVPNVTENQLAELKELMRSPEIYFPYNANYIPVRVSDQTTPGTGYKVFTNKFQFKITFANDFSIQRK